ncbi:MAG: glutathione S-transferase family protein [Pseudomonadota bacterium]|nr:glutathione S-transferase family protein [Pseudomonadota bacterium]
MPELILHHYPMSPFSEKARGMLGLKRLSWHSVHMPSLMPKPDVQALTGGYRRAPLLQVGADIYCDTALIADVLEHLAPTPALYPPGHKGLARALAQWADGTLFWAAMAYGAPAAVAGLPPATAQAFAADRAHMGLSTTLAAPDAAAACRSYLRRIAEMLAHGPWLLGDAPSVADFAACHPLWFIRGVDGARGVLDATPAVVQWMDRVAALGHGTSVPMTGQQAIDVARAATPASLLTDSGFQDEHGIPLGSRVSVRAESFGLEETTGELVAASRTHYSLRRSDPRAGEVQVHFPRIGYVLTRADG